MSSITLLSVFYGYVQVNGRAVLPGASMFEMCAAASRNLSLESTLPPSTEMLHGISITVPLVMPTAGFLYLELTASCYHGSLELHSRSKVAQAAAPHTLHCKAGVTCAKLHSLEVETRAPPMQSGRVAHQLLAPHPRRLVGDISGMGSMFGSPGDVYNGFVFHPAVMDSVLHAAGAFSPPGQHGSPRVPVGLDSLTIPDVGHAPTHGFPTATLEGTPQGHTMHISHRFHGDDRQSVWQLCRLQVKDMASGVVRDAPGLLPAKGEQASECMYAAHWQVDVASGGILPGAASAHAPTCAAWLSSSHSRGYAVAFTNSSAAAPASKLPKIGRASCRERV